MFGVISLLMVMYMLLFFTRIATIILVYTGVTEDVARFQSRSAVTGCGYTTSESESIAGNIVRRRVIGNLMLIGNVGIIASTSSMLLSVVTVGRHGFHVDLALRLGVLGAGLLLLWYCSKRRWFEDATVAIFEFFSRTKMHLAAFHRNTLCHFSNGFRVSEVNVELGSALSGLSAADLDKGFGTVKLLAIRRNVREYLNAPGNGVTLAAGDSLIVYGTGDEIAELIRRSGAVSER